MMVDLSMKTDGKGVDLTVEEQAQVYKIMGENGPLRQAIKRNVMNLLR